MHIEHVARIRLTPRRLAGQQRDLAVARRMFGEIVDDHEHMLAKVAEILGHGDTGKRRDPLQPRRAGCARDDDNAALRSTFAVDRVNRAAHTGCFLPHRDVNADHVAVALVDNGVDGDGGFADGAVADNQLPLPAPQRKQSVHHHQPGLHRLRHQLAVDNRRCRALDRCQCFARNRSLAIERAAQRVDDPAQQLRPHRHAHHIAGAANALPGLDRIGIVEQHTADPFTVQHLGKAELPASELQQLVEAHTRQAGNQRDPIPHLLNPADLIRMRANPCSAEFFSGLGQPGIGQRGRIIGHV